MIGGNDKGDRFERSIGEYGLRALASYFGGSGLEGSVNDNTHIFSHFGSPGDTGPGSICNTSPNLLTPATAYEGRNNPCIFQRRKQLPLRRVARGECE